MPVQTTDTNSLTFTAANQQWIVKAGVVISTTDDNTDAVTIAFANGQLFNHGDISATGGGTFGAHAVFLSSAGSNATIINGATASIIGSVGVLTRADDTHLFNDGMIFGLSSFGVNIGNFVKRADIHNDGYIFGKSAGIQGGVQDTPKVVNTGTIESDGAAVSLGLFDGTATIVNSGTIRGGDGTAITVDGSGSSILVNTGDIIGTVRLVSAFGSDKVVNNGLIDGDLVLSGRADTYSGRHGLVDGTVFGGSDDDRMKGGADDDDFAGEAGQDELVGRAGDDELTGGDRGDSMKGGSGADTFIYRDPEDSKGGFFFKTDRDTILDFRHSQDDRIDLRPLDARIGGESQKFDFIGTADFTGKKGELRYFVDSGNAIVQADITGDRKADLEIKLNDVSSLMAGDFYL